MSDGPREPGILRFIARTQAIAPDEVWDGPPAQQRAVYDQLCVAFRAPRPAGLRVEDLSLALPDRRLALRLYRPPGEALRPGLIYLHGGGFILGGLDSHDDICAEISMNSDVAVLAVDYRLSPEHAYPAALEDGLAALDYLRESAEGFGIDPTRILIAGDSAGGTLAAATTHRLHAGAGPQVQGQILIYPALGGDTTQGSYLENADAPICTRSSIEGYWRAYSPSVPDPDDPAFRPLAVRDASGLPPAFLIACAFDPLLDDAIAYAKLLEACGVPVTLRHEPELVHGYLRARTTSPAAKASFAALCQAVREMA